jgi:hypothetical protein
VLNIFNFIKNDYKDDYGLNDIKHDELSDKEKFDNIMNFALRIIKLKGLNNSKQHPIYDLIRILGRGIQTD